jgi:dTDP-4-amino-4,6-dideoxygalactose transaminase
MGAMKEMGIQTSIHYPPVHLFSAYRGVISPVPQSLAFTESMAAREVTLPLYPSLPDDSIKLVVETVQSSLVRAGRVSV